MIKDEIFDTGFYITKGNFFNIIKEKVTVLLH